jgi:hypothetical protein
VLLPQNAAEAAKTLGVGIETDYKENTNPKLTGQQAFINAYRQNTPMDNHKVRLLFLDRELRFSC